MNLIGQCLSNKNESATVAKNQNFCELNKAFIIPPVVHQNYRGRACPEILVLDATGPIPRTMSGG